MFETGDKARNSHESNYLLSQVEPEDLIEFGMIPEFIGRFNVIANCNELTVRDLIEILSVPKNAVIPEFTQLFAEENVKLTFTEEALCAIAKKAKKTDTGARALRMIVESLLRDLMFEVPSDPTFEEIVIEEETVTKKKPPLVHRKSQEEAEESL